MPIEPEEWDEAEPSDTLFYEFEQFFRENPDNAYEISEVMSELRQFEPDVDDEAEVLGSSIARVAYTIVSQTLVREGRTHASTSYIQDVDIALVCGKGLQLARILAGELRTHFCITSLPCSRTIDVYDRLRLSSFVVSIV